MDHEQAIQQAVVRGLNSHGLSCPDTPSSEAGTDFLLYLISDVDPELPKTGDHWADVLVQPLCLCIARHMEVYEYQCIVHVEVGWNHGAGRMILNPTVVVGVTACPGARTNCLLPRRRMADMHVTRGAELISPTMITWIDDDDVPTSRPF